MGLRQIYNNSTRKVHETRRQRKEDMEYRKEQIDPYAILKQQIVGATSKKQEVNVSRETIMQIPAVVNALGLIVDSIAQLPIYLYKPNPDGSTERISDDIRDYLLNREPNLGMNSYTFKKMLITNFLIEGRADAVIERSGNEVQAIYPLQAGKLTVQVNTEGYKTEAVYSISGENIANEDIICVLKDTEDGFQGTGVLETGEEIFKTALNQFQYSATLYDNLAIPTGILSVPGELTDEAYTNIRNSWDKNFAGSGNAGKTAVLEGGTKYQPISLNPSDLELSASKKDIVAEICRIFCIPESMIDSSKNKYASNESNNLQFLQYTLSPILNAFESEFNKMLLLEDEKLDGMFFQFDTADLLRTVQSEQIDNLVKAVKGRLISINEARGVLGYKSMPKDWWIYSIGDVLYNIETNRLVVSNTGLGIDPDAPLTPEEMAMLNSKLKNEGGGDGESDTDDNKEEQDTKVDEKGGEEKDGNGN